MAEEIYTSLINYSRKRVRERGGKRGESGNELMQSEYSEAN